MTLNEWQNKYINKQSSGKATSSTPAAKTSSKSKLEMWQEKYLPISKGIKSADDFDSYMTDTYSLVNNAVNYYNTNTGGQKKASELEKIKAEALKLSGGSNKKSVSVMGMSGYSDFNMKERDEFLKKNGFKSIDELDKAIQAAQTTDKYDRNFGSEYKAELDAAYDKGQAAITFLDKNKDSIDNYSELRKTMGEYLGNIKSLSEAMTEQQKYYEQWEDEDEYKNGYGFLKTIGKTLKSGGESVAGGYVGASAVVSGQKQTELTMGQSAQAAAKGQSEQEALKGINAARQARASEKEAKANKFFDMAAADEAMASWQKNGLGQLLVSAGTQIPALAGDMALSAAGSLVGMPEAGLTAMAVRSYGQGAIDARNAGLSWDKAALNGVKSAAIEVLTEKMFGGATKLAYGAGIIDDTIEKGIQRALTRAGASKALTKGLMYFMDAGEEGIEEMVSDLLNPLADRILGLKDKDGKYLSSVNIEDMMYDGLVGFVLGLAGTSVNVGVDSVRSARESKQFKALYGEFVQELIDESAEINPGSEIAEKLQGKLNSGEDVSGKEIKALVKENDESIEARDMDIIKFAARDRLELYGETTQLDEKAAAIAKKAAGQKLTNKESKLLDDSLYAYRVSNELDPENIRSGEFNSEWVQSIGTGRINADEYNNFDMEEAPVSQEAPEAEAVLEEPAQELEEQPAQVYDGLWDQDNIVESMFPNEVKSGILSAKDVADIQQFYDMTGRTMDLDELEAMVRDHISKKESNDNGRRNDGLDRSMGRQPGESTAVEAGAVSKSTGKNQRGQRERNNRADTGARGIQSKTAEGNARQSSSREIGIRNGTDSKRLTVIPEEKWPAKFKRIANAFKSAAGKITLVNGNIEIKKGEGVARVTGVTDHRTGNVFVRGNSVNYAAEQLLLHEGGHLYLDSDQAMVDRLYEAALEEMSKQELDNLVASYAVKWSGLYEKDNELSGEEIEALNKRYTIEVLCDALGGIDRPDARGASKLSDAVREAFKQETGIDIQALLDGTESEANTEDTSDKSNKTTETVRNNGPPKESYSIDEIVDADGKSYGIGVKLDSELLTNLSDSERIEMVKEYIKELGGQSFTAYDNNGFPVTISIAESNKAYRNKNGKRVRVNDDLARKYNKSQVKQESIALVDELIVTAKFDKSKKTQYPHGWLDNNGQNEWEYWETFVQDKEKTVWVATLNIATTTNGEKILYDINPIKKVAEPAKSGKPTTKANVAQIEPTVNSYSADDEAYMDAVEAGDMETAQRMVDEAAEAAGYVTHAYHGTLAKGITEFKKEFIGSRFSYDEVGFFFTDNLKLAEDYAVSEFDSNKRGEVISAYIKTSNAFVFDKEYAINNGYGNLFKDNDAVDVWDTYQSDLLDEAEEMNADSIIIKDGMSMMVVAFEPNHIKSAEPVVYDDSGEVVPLSERFNEDSNDIRYSADDGEFYDNTSYSAEVTDEDVLEFLDNQETIKTYKSMQLVDGKLYPPMAAVVAGQYEGASKLGTWEMAVEHPELIKIDKKSGKPKFALNKGKGQGSVDAAYNPYMHSSNLVLNDQFTAAYKRNLVTVECEIPVSELTSGYKAQYAKDPVGMLSWHTGPVAGQLPKDKKRMVYLTRWLKPVRIVPDSEVALMYADLLVDDGITVPNNVVTPSLLSELEKVGVNIDYSGIERVEAPRKKKKAGASYSVDDEAYMETVESGDMDAAQRMVDEAAKAAGYSVPLWHGTPNGTFNVFRDWSYFTADKSYADVYQNQGASVNYKKTANAPRTYAVYAKLDNVFDTRNKKEKRIFENEFYRKWGNGAPLSERGLPDWTDGDDFIEFFEENGYEYDTLLLDEGGTGGYGEAVNDRGISYVIKNSAQLKSADPVTYDDNGNIIPLSERFNEDNEDIRYSADDEAYMDAYLDGDDDRMQEILDKVAARHGYRYKAYHHTENSFTKFDLNRARKTSDIQGFYFSADPEAESEYGSVRYDTYLKMQNPYIVDSKESARAIPLDLSKDNAGVIARQWLLDNGYDSVIRKAEYYGAEADEYIVLNANQIKSADIATYTDEYGEDIIPLSERFDESEDDIRFSADDNLLVSGQSGYADTLSRVQADARRMSMAKLEDRVSYYSGRIKGYEQTDKRSEKMDIELQDLQNRRKIYDNALKKKKAKSAEQKQVRTNAKTEAQATAKRITDVQGRRRSKQTLRDTIFRTFNIESGRAEAAGIIDAFADKYAEQGKISRKDINALYNALMHRGLFVAEAEDYAVELRAHLAGNTVRVPAEVKAEFGDDWQAFYRRAWANKIYLKIDSGSNGIDTWTEELADAFGEGTFDRTADLKTQLERIVEVAEEGRDEKMDLFQMADYIRKREGKDTADAVLEELYTKMESAIKNYAANAKIEMDITYKNAFQMAKDRAIREENYRRAQEKKNLQQRQKDTLKQLQALKRMRDTTSKEYRDQIDKVLEGIDTIAVSAAHAMHYSEKYDANYGSLVAMYKEAKANDPNFLEDAYLEKLMERIDGKHLADMEPADLEQLYQAAVALRTKIYNTQNIVGSETDMLFDEAYDSVRNEMQQADKPKNKHGFKWKKLRSVLNPNHYLEALAGWNPDSVWFKSFVQGLVDGELKTKRYVETSKQMLDEFAQTHKEWLAKADGQGKDGIWYEVTVLPVASWGKGDTPVFNGQRNGFEPIYGEPITVYMTPLQKVHMYLESKNNDNLAHMLGGRVFADKELYSKGKKKEAFTSDPIHLAPKDVKQLCSDLTPEEQELANILERYYNTYAKTEINKVSNVLYGFDRAMADNYAPIFTKDTYNEFTPAIIDGTAEGVGHLKTRIKGARTPTINLSAMEAFDKHVSQTSRFVGMSIPLHNMKGLLNWTQDGKKLQSVIEQEWSSEDLEYIKKLITDLENPNFTEPGYIESEIDKLQSAYIGSVFGFNPSVALKVFGSWNLASAELGFENAKGAFTKVDPELIRKYTSEYDVRVRGYASPEVARLVNSQGKIEQLIQGNKITKELFGGGLMIHTDAMVARSMWAWAEAAVRNENPDLEVGTQEEIDAGQSPFYKEVARRFNLAIGNTQSMYDIMHRSELLRSDKTLDRAFTMFHTDIMQAANLLIKAKGEAAYYQKAADADPENKELKDKAEKAAKAIRKTAFGVATSSMLVALVTVLNSLLKRRDEFYDEEEFLWKKFGIDYAIYVLKDFAGMFAGRAEVIIGAGVDFIKGDKWYEVEIMGLSLFNDLVETSMQLARKIINGTANADDGKDLAFMIARLAGLPLDNVERYILGTMSWVSPEFGEAYNNMIVAPNKAGLKGKTGDILERDVYDMYKGFGADRNTTDEIARLYELGYDKIILGKAPKQITIDGTEYALDDDAVDRYNAAQADVLSNIDEVINSDEYQNADDTERMEMLKRLNAYATEVAKAAAEPAYNMSSWAKSCKGLVDSGESIMAVARMPYAEKKTSSGSGESTDPRYVKLIKAGVEYNNARDIEETLTMLEPENGAKIVTQSQKVSAIAYMPIPEDEKSAAIQLIYGGSEKKSFEKYQIAMNAGLSSAAYADFLSALDRVNDNSGVSRDEFKQAVRASNMPDEVAAQLWKTYGWTSSYSRY